MRPRFVHPAISDMRTDIGDDNVNLMSDYLLKFLRGFKCEINCQYPGNIGIITELGDIRRCGASGTDLNAV